MSIQTRIGDTFVGVERPVVLLGVPVAVVVVGLLIRYRASGTASTRSRQLLLASRVVVTTAIVVASAGPFTVVTTETQGDPSVTMLVDRSNSTDVSPSVAGGLAEAIEDEGVPTTVATIGQGTDSPIGDAIGANVREDGSVLVVSDGQVTEGRRLAETAEYASSLNATISSVSPDPTQTERYVRLSGPRKASIGVESRFLIRVSGVEATDSVDVTVSVDGESITSERIDSPTGSVGISYTFEETGTHRITAKLDGEDTFAVNNVARKTVRIVDQPRVLYVSRGEYPLQEYLNQLYDVETNRSVPNDLDPYYAVVVQDVASPGLGNVGELQEFVIDGNGLVMVGGSNSFENGGYANASVASMLPVTFGESTQGSARIVMLIDVSGSASEGMRIQKAIALDALSQLSEDNTVGVVGFNQDAYRVSKPVQLSEGRDQVKDRIRRLEAGGATDIATGLKGAQEMLNGERGTIILLSDGRDTSSQSGAVANTLRREGIQVVAIGAGQNINEGVLRRIADESDGNYFRANETERLRLLFGGASKEIEADGLTILDSSHFITSGVDLESNPDQANDVSIRPGAEFLVAGSDGDPAVATWRYGLGRVTTITTFGTNGGLDGLLTQPDSLLVTKSVNHAIGDPQRKATGVTDVADTRVGEPTTVVSRGSSPPNGTEVSFSEIDDNVYQGEVIPSTPGFKTVAGTTYATNYHAEYAGFGPSPALADAVRTTGGKQFDRDEAAEIATFTRQQSTRVRDVRQSFDWVLLAGALFVFLTEVIVRRLEVYTGRTQVESGLP